MKPKLSNVLKKLRHTHEMTQQEVADFLGITRQAYSRYESSIREPDMETLNKLATLYKVGPQVFYINDPEKLLDAEMDIVELVARYQLKQILNDVDDDGEASGLEKHVKTQDLEQVQTALNNYFGLTTTTESSTPSKPLKRRIIKYGLYLLILLVAVNVGFMTLHRFDPNYQYDILDYSYINAITPDQNVNATMYLDIVRVTEFNPENAQIGDNIIIYGDFGLNEYFVEEITSINQDDQTVTTTYDDQTSVTNEFNDVIGFYEREANLFGTIFYASKFNTGYLFLVIGHVLLVSMYYLSFMDSSKR